MNTIVACSLISFTTLLFGYEMAVQSYRDWTKQIF